MDKPHEEHKSENRHRHDSKPYTRIDNELLEATARIRIPGEAMQVLLVIARKTYGYQKREDSISLSQFNLYTGISKPSIVRAIETLSKMNIIYKKVNGHSAIYRINKDFFTWNPLPKRSTFTKKLINVYKKVNNRLLKSNPQKKKEKKKKECSPEDSHSFPSSTGTPVREIISYFSHLALTEQGVNPVVDGADTKAVQRALRIMSQDDIQRAIKFYVGSTKAKEHGLTLSIALSKHSLNLWKSRESKSSENTLESTNNMLAKIRKARTEACLKI